MSAEKEDAVMGEKPSMPAVDAPEEAGDPVLGKEPRKEAQGVAAV